LINTHRLSLRLLLLLLLLLLRCGVVGMLFYSLLSLGVLLRVAIRRSSKVFIPGEKIKGLH
jgi:hypothetical protein